MKLAPIVQRLKDKGVKRVYGALELAGLAKAPAQLPAHFVVPDRWSAGENRHHGVHHQRTVEEFGVVILVPGRGLRDDLVSDEIAELEAAVIDALAGWTPPDASRACDLIGGRMLSVGGSTVGWMVSLRTGSEIRKVPS